MARATITVDITLEHITCVNCGMVFAFSGDLIDKRRRDHQSFYCPSGHNNYFPGESDVEKLKRELKEANLAIKRAEYRAQSAQLEREEARQQLSATRGRTDARYCVSTLKKRIANGVCPCCHRTFVNMQKHMETKHPEYAAQETTE
jgi:Zn ribbon nucleic-acid-binding protein